MANDDAACAATMGSVKINAGKYAFGNLTLKNKIVN
jgi:hypothetical protein